MLLYPGKDGTPLSSIRLENIRDGIEDYEVLALLEETLREQKMRKAGTDPGLIAEAEALLAVPEAVTSSWTEYTIDPEVIRKCRIRADRVIEALLSESRRGGISGSGECAGGGRCRPRCRR
ncbi:MAG: hypothetical protein BWY31_03567 [Lentisphaerae bacterium ADurb.Bin242]|nr:MAG: hypothetical protein BWY31_03567 [Lentisphaerae bacterium ADurb.Bin242]